MNATIKKKFKELKGQEPKKDKEVFELSSEPFAEEPEIDEQTEEEVILQDEVLDFGEKPTEEDSIIPEAIDDYVIKVGFKYYKEGGLGNYTSTGNISNAWHTNNYDIAYARAKMINGEIIKL